MKIFDAFIFFNELDLLDIRLEELYNDIDFFIICESTKTLQNKDKPLYFLENKKRYEKYLDKIVHHVFEPKEFPHQWYIEFEQRNAIKQANFKMSDEDIFLLSDADEIVRAECIQFIRNNKQMFVNPCTCVMQMSYYYINTVIQEPYDHKNWRGTVIMPKHFFDSKSLSDCRLVKDSLPNLWNAGWHFSFLGGAEKVKLKIESFGHSELNNHNYNSIEIINKRLSSLEDPFSRKGFKIKKEDDLEKFPASSLRFKNLFL
jgi:beta-1,4-mannosyl-glycoprotein beta-1,4-N-acetylglucosaminyltransferase